MSGTLQGDFDVVPVMSWRRAIPLLLGCMVAVSACGSGTADEPLVSAARPAPAIAATISPTPTSAPIVKVALPIRFHPQRDPDWCDPADLQMWMELDGVGGLPSTEFDAQRQIWNYEIAHNDGFTLAQWHASPFAVASAFDHFAQRADVGDSPFSDVQSAGTVISRSVAERQEPLIALIDGGSHYVLISGVTLGPGGTAGAPAAVLLNDPWTYGPTRGGYTTLGTRVELSWSDFVKRFTPDDPHDLGIWSGKWVLIAVGLPLRG